MDTWCEKYPDCAEGVVREWQVLGLVTGYFSLCTLCPLFPVALLAPNERCEQLGSAPNPDQFSSHLFPFLDTQQESPALSLSAGGMYSSA